MFRQTLSRGPAWRSKRVSVMDKLCCHGNDDNNCQELFESGWRWNAGEIDGRMGRPMTYLESRVTSAAVAVPNVSRTANIFQLLLGRRGGSRGIPSPDEVNSGFTKRSHPSWTNYKASKGRFLVGALIREGAGIFSFHSSQWLTPSTEGNRYGNMASDAEVTTFTPAK